MRLLALVSLLLTAHASAAPFTIYFIDVEGGAAMLAVTPGGKSMLVDSGYPDLADRDRDRILRVVQGVAGLDRIDAAVVSHWHNDHYGNHAALAAEIPIGRFYDRGIPDALQEDTEFETRIAKYRAATQNQSVTVAEGAFIPLGDDVTVHVMAASRGTLEGGQSNPFASEHEPRNRDNSDNAASLALLIEHGPFRVLNAGDLTWNVEAELVTPTNPLGRIDLYMVTHHGLPSSNNPVLVKAIEPQVTVMCNGPAKGGHAKVLSLLRSLPSLEASFQLHANLSVPLQEQTPASRIANFSDTSGCEGRFVKVEHEPGAKTFTVGIEGRAAETFTLRD